MPVFRWHPNQTRQGAIFNLVIEICELALVKRFVD